MHLWIEWKTRVHCQHTQQTQCVDNVYIVHIVNTLNECVGVYVRGFTHVEWGDVDTIFHGILLGGGCIWDSERVTAIHVTPTIHDTLPECNPAIHVTLPLWGGLHSGTVTCIAGALPCLSVLVTCIPPVSQSAIILITLYKYRVITTVSVSYFGCRKSDMYILQDGRLYSNIQTFISKH